MILRILVASIVALCLGFYAETSQAGQSFICEDGRLLQLEMRDIERLKREDPCIAAHFGVTIGKVPLPVKRPEMTVVSGLKGAQQAAAAEREIGAVAEVSVDYRRVRIINAPPSGQAWFNHTR